MHKLIILISSSLFILAGCQSAPKRLNEVQEGHWKARALIKDLRESKSYVVNLNLNAVREQRVRMDVTSALQTGVASLLVDQNEVRYILFDSKRFYYGEPQPGVMRPILAIPLDPRWLHNILFEIPFTEKSWTCVLSKGRLSECRDSVTGLKISWSPRQGDKRSILIEHSNATVQLNLNNFEAKVEDRKNLFVLEAPANYQKLRVR